MNNYLDGFDRKEVTLSVLYSAEKGKTVSMVKDFTVEASSDGDDFIGVCTNSENNSASVLLSGYVRVSYTGEAPACGYNKLTADGAGGVKKDTNGRAILVTDVDEADMTCGIIL
ncbi:MAG: hypothetical protein IJN88_07640 [Clostridia bacterium]|nr:hypothetical protein [Clostridia bacterium]